MKIFWIVLAILALGFATFSLVNYLLQRRREKKAQAEGIVVYATVASIDAVGGWTKSLNIKKIVLRVQDPGENTPREVTIRSRIEAGQKIAPGMRLAVAVDPTNPKRVYPAGPEASKRAVVTGSRLERRQMRVGGAGSRSGPGGAMRDPVPMPRVREKRR